MEPAYDRSRLRPTSERSPKSISQRVKVFSKKSSWIRMDENAITNDPPQSTDTRTTERLDDDFHLPKSSEDKLYKPEVSRLGISPNIHSKHSHQSEAFEFEFNPSWDWQSCGENVYRQELNFDATWDARSNSRETDDQLWDVVAVEDNIETELIEEEEQPPSPSPAIEVTTGRPTVSKFDQWSKGMLVRVVRNKKLFRYQSFYNNEPSDVVTRTSKEKLKVQRLPSGPLPLEDRNDVDSFYDEEPSVRTLEETYGDFRKYKYKGCESRNGDTSITKDDTRASVFDEGSDAISYADSVFTYRTENVPLLKAWGANCIDCNNCVQSKAQKTRQARKKRAEAKIKQLEELWGRNQFYWKYESIKDKRKEALDELDTLVSALPPQNDMLSADVRRPFDVPLGFQLSTITEGDEDVDGICSPRNKPVSLVSGCIRQDGNIMTVDSFPGNLWDNSNKNANCSCPEELKDFTNIDLNQHEQHRKSGIIGSNEGGAWKESTKPLSEKKKDKSKSSKARKRKSSPRPVVLKNNEIVIPNVNDFPGDASTDESRGAISDITEDYLHIPFSSPLYGKVLQAFREAAAQRQNAEREIDDEDEVGLSHLVSIVL